MKLLFSVDVLPEWERRGEGGEEYRSCLRALPQADLCNGFFVALLERNPTTTTTTSCPPAGKKSREKGRGVPGGDSESAGDVAMDVKCAVERLSEEEDGRNGEWAEEAPGKKKRKKQRTVPAPEFDAEIDGNSVVDNSHIKTKKKKKKKKVGSAAE